MTVECEIDLVGSQPPRSERADLGRFARLNWRKSASRLAISGLRQPILTTKVSQLDDGTNRLALGCEILPDAQL